MFELTIPFPMTWGSFVTDASEVQVQLILARCIMLLSSTCWLPELHPQNCLYKLLTRVKVIFYNQAFMYWGPKLKVMVSLTILTGIALCILANYYNHCFFKVRDFPLIILEREMNKIKNNNKIDFANFVYSCVPLAAGAAAVSMVTTCGDPSSPV